MSVFDNPADNQKLFIRILTLLNVVTLLIITYLLFSLNTAREHLQIDLPPDLSKGATVAVGERNIVTVYDFAHRIFQSIQYWNSNGEINYETNIKTNQNFLTPQYRAWLNRDYQRRLQAGELRNRERTLTPIPTTWDAKRVQVLSKTSWVVYLDMKLTETYKGEIIKQLYLRYPMKVVQHDVDHQSNPWSLALDGYYSEPTSIEELNHD